MANPYVLRKNKSQLRDLLGGNAALGLGVGNVYYVVQATNTGAYTYAMQNLQQKYTDGSMAVQVTIQAALDATVASRNDYVIVFPDASDYDITAALTMSKKAVHLICPAGLGTNGFPLNAARIHQNTNATACITVTGDAVEIAGLFFKGEEGSDIITLSGTRWHDYIHDCFFGIAATAASNNYGVVGTGACSHCVISDNYFTNYSPGLMTGTNNDVAAFIALTSNTSTRNNIRNNIMMTGANTTVAAAISYAGYGGVVTGNYIWENVAFGSSDAGVLTLGISTSADCLVADNRIGIATEANGVDGGTANQSYVVNYEGTSGGTLLT